MRWIVELGCGLGLGPLLRIGTKREAHYPFSLQLHYTIEITQTSGG